MHSEYLALFKKTVAMHEVFLQRIAAHFAMREDYNFRVFLEYGEEVKENHVLLAGRQFQSFPFICVFVVECEAEEHEGTFG